MLQKFPMSANTGLLVLRLGVGVMMALHGLPKIVGGPDQWAGLGGALPFLPDALRPVAGFLAAVAEFGGGLCLATGVLFRWACLFLMGTMAVAFSTKLGEFNGVMDFAYQAGWPLELLVVFTALFITGPGDKFRLGKGPLA